MDAFLTDGQGDSTLRTPTTLQAVGQCDSSRPAFFYPLSEQLDTSKGSDVRMSTAITTLLLRRRPSAIVRGIMPFVIYTVKRMLRSRLTPHNCQEVFKRSEYKLDASTTITTVVFIRRYLTPGFCGVVGSIFSSVTCGFRFAVQCKSLFSQIALFASARLGRLIGEVIGGHDARLATLTTTKPFGNSWGSWGGISNKAQDVQTSEMLVAQISTWSSFHHIRSLA